VHVEIDALYKRFGFCASVNGSYMKAKNEIVLKKTQLPITMLNDTIKVNDKVEANMVFCFLCSNIQ